MRAGCPLWVLYHDGKDAVLTQCVRRLLVAQVDCWPSTSAVEKGPDYIFWEYCKGIFFANLTNELWWLFGLTFRSVCRIILLPLLQIALLEVAVGRASSDGLDYALVIGSISLFVQLWLHITSCGPCSHRTQHHHPLQPRSPRSPRWPS